MRRKSFLATSLALGLSLALAVGAWAANLIQISSDPYTNPDSQHATQVEPDSYSSGNTIVTTFQSGRYFDGGASNIGWATSFDGGQTWTDGFLPSLTVHSDPPGPFDRASDPVMAYDAKHNVWMASVLGLVDSPSPKGVAVDVSRSSDGLNWSAPVTVSSTTGGFYDKNWTACDNSPGSPYYGNCYTTWDDASLGNRIYMSTSSDGGLTWGPKKAPRGNLTGIGGIPLARPDGTVVVPLSNAFGTAIRVFGSLNGGQSWTRAKTISSVNAHTVAGGLRVPNYLPSADVDAAGELYVIWADCRFRSGCSANDIVMSTSTNGRNWAPVMRIPIDATNSGVDHFIPGLVVDQTTSGDTARLALTYYYYPTANCSFSTCQLHVGFVSSLDGGMTWSAPQTLAGPMSLSWLANTSQGRMVGDYISTSFVGANAAPVFSLANAPSGDVFDQATYATLLPVTLDLAYPSRLTPDPVLATRSDRPAQTRPIVIP